MDVSAIMDIYVMGIEWGAVITFLVGFVSWGFWAVVGFFKSVSRA